MLDGCYDFIDSLYFNPLPINPDSRLAPWRYLKNLIGQLEESDPEDTEHDTMTSDEEEFAQLLNQFINGDYEKEKEEDEEEPRIELPAEAPDADPLRQLILQAKQAVRKKDD